MSVPEPGGDPHRQYVNVMGRTPEYGGKIKVKVKVKDGSVSNSKFFLKAVFGEKNLLRTDGKRYPPQKSGFTHKGGQTFITSGTLADDDAVAQRGRVGEKADIELAVSLANIEVAPGVGVVDPTSIKVQSHVE